MTYIITFGAAVFYVGSVVGLISMGLIFTEYNATFCVPIILVGTVGFIHAAMWHGRLSAEKDAANGLPARLLRSGAEPDAATVTEVVELAASLRESHLKEEIHFSTRLIRLGVRLTQDYVNQTLSRWTSHFSIETRILASLAVLAGLVGTFVGLATSVADYQTIVGVGSDGGFIDSVQAILAGLDQAFGSTALGAVTAMTLEAVNRMQERERGALARKIEKYFLESILSAASRITDSRLARQFQDILIQETSEQTRKVADTLKSTTSLMAESSAQFTAAVVGIASSLDTIGTIGPTLDKSIGLVRQAQDGFSGLVDDIQRATGSLHGAVREIRSAVAESASSGREALELVATKLEMLGEQQAALVAHASSLRSHLKESTDTNVEGQKRLDRRVRGLDDSIRLVHEALVSSQHAESTHELGSRLDLLNSSVLSKGDQLAGEIANWVRSQDDVGRTLHSELGSIRSDMTSQTKDLATAARLLVQAAERIQHALGQGTPADTLEHLGSLARSSATFAKQSRTLTAEIALLRYELQRPKWWQFWRRNEAIGSE